MRPSLESIRRQTMPAATSGITCGRNRTVRAIVPVGPLATRRMSEAMSSPSATGTTLKKKISLKALPMMPSRAGSVSTLM